MERSELDYYLLISNFLLQNILENLNSSILVNQIIASYTQQLLTFGPFCSTN